MKHIIYSLYDKHGLYYIGKTGQKLQNRLRSHFFKKPMVRTIDIDAIVRIEYMECATEADMHVLEIYYINKYKPVMNRCRYRARDELTVSLLIPYREKWVEFDSPLMEKWKDRLSQKNAEERKCEDANKHRLVR